MSLRIKYFIFIILLHCILTGLLFYVFIERKYIFLALESLIILSLYISYSIYRSFIYPIELMQAGQVQIEEEDFTIKYNLTGSKEIDSLIAIYNSMIDKLRVEKTNTEEQSYFLENLISQSPIGMVIMNFDNKIELINNKASDLFESNSCIGQSIQEINSELTREISKLKLYDEKTIKVSNNRKYKCRLHQIIHKGFPRQFILIEDLTQELLNAEKEAFGKVIRMMAHEVNNSTGAINSILETIKEFGFSDDDEEDLSNSLSVAIERNKSLGKFTDHFAEIIRLPYPNLSEFDLQDCLKDMTTLYSAKLRKKNISILLNFETASFRIKGDRVQLEQVFSNIIKNSIEAIGENGKINILTDVSNNIIIIEDSGSGIDAIIQDKLFTPFFSTKTNGQGIGLMLIREILNNHYADYSLSSKNGITQFVIKF